jgi:hypothetical protein
VISRSFRNSVQTNRGQEPRTHKLWGVGPLRRWRGQPFASRRRPLAHRYCGGRQFLFPCLLHLPSLPTLSGLPNFRIELEREASPAMVTSTNPPVRPPGDDGLLKSTNAASFTRRSTEDVGTSRRWVAAADRRCLGPRHCWQHWSPWIHKEKKKSESPAMVLYQTRGSKRKC